MSEEYTSFEEKRRHLIADIARQRSELGVAYRNLEKPIHYAEYGMRGFGFVRQNPWIFVAFPSVIKVGAILLGLRNKAAAKPAPRQRPSMEKRLPKGLVGKVVKLGGLGWKAFRVYRRVRTYFS